MVTITKKHTGEIKLPVKYSKTHYTIRRLVKEQYTKEQKGLCMYCKSSLKKDPPKEVTSKKIRWEFFPRNFRKYLIHLQHNHKTDLTEGVVHAYCNAVLWQYHGR